MSILTRSLSAVARLAVTLAASASACAYARQIPASSRLDRHPLGILQLAPFTMVVTTDRRIYAAGATVEALAVATNNTKQPVRLEFATGQRFSLTLYRGTVRPGRALWSWASDKMFNDMVSTIMLAPGRHLRFKATIGPRSDPPYRLTAGTYTVAAVLTTMGSAPRPNSTAIFTVR